MKTTAKLQLTSKLACKLVWIATLLAVMSPVSVSAQARSSAGAGVAQAATGQPTDNGGLGAAEIISRVRSAGYDPRSRPLQRGAVYFLFALDRQYMDVRLTVDANSGRVLSATRLAGAHYGGPGYDGHDVLTRIERPPVPPADIPNRGTARNNVPAASASPQAPLPRARPGEVVTGAVTEAPAEPPAAPPAEPGTATAEAPTATVVVAPPVPPPTQSPAVLPRPQQPAMVPIAPLE